MPDSHDPEGLTAPSVPTDSGSAPKLHSSARENYPLQVQRVIPNSPEAEKGVLSCMLQDPDTCIGEATVHLGEGQFYNPGRQILYKTIVELHDQGQPVDIIALTTTLKDRKQLDQVGGPAELGDCLGYAPAAAHFEYYAGILRNKYILRRIIRSSNNNISKAYEESDSVDHILDNYEADVLAIRESLDKNDTIRSMRDHLFEAIAQIEDMFTNRGRTMGIATGYPDFDAMTNGLQPGQMIVVAARPSMGKTSLGMNIVENMALKEQLPVAVFSLEMGADQLTQRLLCSQAGIAMSKVMSGMLSEKRDFPRIQHAAARLSACSIYIDDTPGLSIMAMRAKARRMKKQFGVQAIMIDYLQLMRSESRRAQDNRQQEVAEISAGIKALAKELGVPIIVLAQLNRGPETRAGSNRPRLSDLRESGSIEQDADVVSLLMRDEYYAESDEERDEVAGRSTLIVGKNRNGATGDVPLTFLKELMRFESRARDEGEP